MAGMKEGMKYKPRNESAKQSIATHKLNFQYQRAMHDILGNREDHNIQDIGRVHETQYEECGNTGGCSQRKGIKRRGK